MQTRDMFEALFSEPLVSILLVCVLFGAFGGCVAHWINNEKQRLAHASSRAEEGWFLYPSLRQSAGIGAAGAIAFLFFIIAVGGLTNFQTLTEQLRSMAVSVIAGFGARSLLPRMVGHLEKQVAEARTEAGEAKTEAEKATQEAKEALAKADEIRRSAEERMGEAEARLKEAEERLRTIDLNEKLEAAARKEASPQHVKEALALFEEARRDGTAKSAIWINGARVQRWHVSHEEAIATLDAAIAVFEAGKLPKDSNYPAAYYNRGCYYAQRFIRSNNADDCARAFRDLDACLKRSENPGAELAEMLGDPDLAELVSLEDFQALVVSYGPLKED